MSTAPTSHCQSPRSGQSSRRWPPIIGVLTSVGLSCGILSHGQSSAIEVSPSLEPHSFLMVQSAGNSSANPSANPSTNPSANNSLCPSVFEAMTTHRIAAGETLESIARQYNLLPETLMGLNPSLRNRQAPVGQSIVIPPFNGIRVDVPPGTSLRDLAAQYKVRSDVLFEVNGCQSAPSVAFIPGIVWTPLQPTTGATVQFPIAYPLPKAGAVLMGFGFQLRDRGTVTPHSGVDLAAPIGTPVLAGADGTVAFSGSQGAFGNMVVINHAQGYQTRYAQLDRIQVKLGQQIKRSTTIGTVGQTGKPSSSQSHLHFEVRSNSKLGWVAENPTNYLQPPK